jgi:primosomal protein N' (replication factor Y)
MDSYTTFVSVIVDLAIDKPLDYGVPKELLPLAKRGMQVTVPLRNRLRTGYILDIKEKSSCSKILPLHAIANQEELLLPELFELALWMSRYYNASLRQVLKSILPATIRHQVRGKEQLFIERVLSKEKLREVCLLLRRKKPAQARVIDTLLMASDGLLLTELLEKAGVGKRPIEQLEKQGVLKIEKIHFDRSPLKNVEYIKTPPKLLNEAQGEALKKMISALQEKKFETHLLYGITGSGKTEIYLQAIEYTLQLGLSALMLVPEISLTGQTIERFMTRFDRRIALLHHRLSEGERRDEWHRIHRGEAKIVIGARSALFAPLRNLGIIIVDEEHDAAYKQSEEAPCYHARDVAVMRGKINQALVVLGSATPSIESYFNAERKKYILSFLPHRASQATLPHVHVIDMKREYEKANGFTPFSELLIESIKKRIALGEQVILFLNRRGYHTSLQCIRCGYIFSCTSCSTSLTFHRNADILACHLCDKQITPLPRLCPQCKQGEALKFKGIGTEQLERHVHALFPGVRTLRIDSDTTRHKGSHERLFNAFRTQKADILIGTQMIAKGLHFPAVTLVAAIHCDSGLQIPDFRASERTFQQITQVSGRSGRGELSGEVILQTLLPDNTTLSQAASQDYEQFFRTEIETRKIFSFPPYTHLIKLTFSGLDASAVQQEAQSFCSKVSQKLGNPYVVHPVVPSGYAKIKDRFRFQCLIRTPHVYPVNCAIQKSGEEFPLKKSKLLVDVDPLSTFF